MRAFDRGISVFDDVSERELRTMGPARTFHSGETLFPLRTYPILIRDGLAKLVTAGDGGETLLSIHGAGTLLGAESLLAGICGVRTSLLAGGPATTAIALTKVNARALQAQSLEKFFRSNPRAIAAMAIGLHERL